MDKEIMEGNKLIAEFMGWKFETIENEFGGEVFAYFGDELQWQGQTPSYLNSLFISENGFAFHCNWNILMPAVEKIFLLREVRDVEIRPGRCWIWMPNGKVFESPNKPGNNSITECWLAITDFITWYNTTKPQSNG